MSQCYTIWGGDEWQKHITTLLGVRYGARYQPIPDRDGGDWGLEGYCDDGCVYQCYAAEEPVGVSELTDKQRDKITRDIGKFCANAAQLQTILGPLKITQWVLLVPRCDSKRILVHAETKAAEVRALNLSIVGGSFRIAVQTDDIFHKERAMIASEASMKLKVETPGVAPAAVSAWSMQNTALDTVISKKLAKLSFAAEAQEAMKAELIRFFLEGQNLLQFFKDSYPEVYNQLQASKSNHERIVRMDSLAKNSSAPSQIQELYADYRKRITDEVRSVNLTNADTLGYEAIADWLVRCPLDFPEPPKPVVKNEPARSTV